MPELLRRNKQHSRPDCGYHSDPYPRRQPENYPDGDNPSSAVPGNATQADIYSNAIRWLGGDAARYRKDVIKNKPQTVFALEVLLQVSHADFFPFGLKDYRLVRYLRKLPRKSVRGTMEWWTLAVFQKVFFQFQGLALTSAVFLVLGAHAPDGITRAPRNMYGWHGRAALGILLMIGIVLLACESFMSYVVPRILRRGIPPSRCAPPAHPRRGRQTGRAASAGRGQEPMIGTITYLLLTIIVLAGLAGVAITASEKSDQ